MQASKQTANWRFLLRLLGKAAGLFVILNLLFAWLNPSESLGLLTLYNWLVPGRQRLPYGENASESYNLSLYNIPAMMNSHELSGAKSEDEYRVLIIGDSGTWGWLLENEDTLAGQINSGNYVTADGRKIRAYNLGYPVMSLLKDVMILEASLGYEPDMVVWPLTLESFPRDKQLFSPIVQNNPARIRSLIENHDLLLESHNDRLVDLSLWEKTLVGQRRSLADLVRLQLYGFSWAATDIDQAIPEEITLRKSDFEEDLSWQEFDEPLTLSEHELAFDVLRAGSSLTGDVPLLIINEPMFISSGENSDLRYNSFYPRWAYDQYREMLQSWVEESNLHYIDLWDTISAQEFSDTPVHLSPEGSQQMAIRVVDEILRIANN